MCEFNVWLVGSGIFALGSNVIAKSIHGLFSDFFALRNIFSKRKFSKEVKTVLTNIVAEHAKRRMSDARTRPRPRSRPRPR